MAFLEARASLVPGLSVTPSVTRSHFSSSTCQINTNYHCYGQDDSQVLIFIRMFWFVIRMVRICLRMARTILRMSYMVRIDIRMIRIIIKINWIKGAKSAAKWQPSCQKVFEELGSGRKVLDPFCALSCDQRIWYTQEI